MQEERCEQPELNRTIRKTVDTISASRKGMGVLYVIHVLMLVLSLTVSRFVFLLARCFCVPLLSSTT